MINFNVYKELKQQLSHPAAQERIKQLREWRVLVKANPAKFRVNRSYSSSDGFHFVLEEHVYEPYRDWHGWNAIAGQATEWYPLEDVEGVHDDCYRLVDYWARKSAH